MTLNEFFEGVYRPLKLRSKSQNTVRLYRITIRNFARTLNRQPTIADLTDEIVGSHLCRFRELGRSPATVNKERCQLLALWRFACQREMITRWPCVPMEIEPQRAPLAWLPEELNALIAACESQKGFVGEVPAKIFWPALLAVLLDTGERIGAILGLRWHHLSKEWLLVPAELRKGKKRDRTYCLSADTLAKLDRLRQFNQSRMFHWPYYWGYLWQKFGLILQEAGLQADRKSKFHRLRKTVASAHAMAGNDPQAAMDHQFRRTTERYIDPRVVPTPESFSVIGEYLASVKKRKKRTG